MSKQQSLKELGSLVSKRTLTRFITLLKRANTVIKSGKRERVRLNIKSMGKSGLDVEVINDGSANETTKNDLLQQLTKLASNKGLQRLTKVVQKVAKQEHRKNIMKRIDTFQEMHKSNLQEDFIEIEMIFQVTIWHGRGKEPDYQKRKSFDYAVIEYQTGRSDAKFQEALEEAYHKLYKKFEGTIESGTIFDKILEKKYWVLSQSELLKHAHNPSQIKMRVSVPTDYKFITGIELNKPINKDECVSDYLLSVYKKKIPTLTKEKIDEIMYDNCVLSNLDGLKIDIVVMTEECEESGRTAEQIQKFCDYYKISHYAFDVNHNLFIKKTVTPKSKYPAMMYYCIDGHLYPLTDPATRKSITSANAGKTIAHSTSLTFKEIEAEKREQLTIDRSKLPYHEDIELDQLKNYKDCNIFYHVGDLKDTFLKLFERDNTQYKAHFRGANLISIDYLNNVQLFANVNHKLPGDENWSTSMDACEKFNIPYKNQSLFALCNEIYERFHTKGSKKFLRKFMSAKVKNEVLQQQMYKCNNCKINLKNTKWELDHIIPLSGYGDNEIENLQCLCKPCHDEKSAKESAEIIFKMDNTLSTYNQFTKQIFSKAKNGFIHCYEDSEYVQKQLQKNKGHLFGMDINKCRTNIWRYSDYDYCVFSVLDDIQKFRPTDEEHNQIPIGFYYIETKRMLPLKGNGWYSYPVVRYCIENKLIKLTDIRYCVFPSLDVKHDYYAKFIDFIKDNAGKHAKVMINGLVGIFGNKITKTRKLFLCRDINEASYQFFSNPERAHVLAKKDSDYKDYYEVMFKTDRYNDDSFCPIFNQILDIEAMELHKLCKVLKKHNGQMVYTNTDHGLAMFENEEDIKKVKKEMSKQFWDEECKVPKWKEDSVLKEKDRKETPNETVYKYEIPEYEIIEDPKTNDFKTLAKEVIAKNQSFQIDGRAGCGKTHLLKQIIKQLRKDSKNIAILCPTHKACRVLDPNAQTLNSFFSQCSIITSPRQKS